MPKNDMENILAIRHMSFEKKLELLGDSDKEYLRGYIDRALMAEAQKKDVKEKNHTAAQTKGGPQTPNDTE